MKMNKIESKINFLIEFNTDIIDSNGEEIFETKLNINQAIKDISLYIKGYIINAFNEGYHEGFSDCSSSVDSSKGVEKCENAENYYKTIS